MLAKVPPTGGTRRSPIRQLLDYWYGVTYLLNNLNRGFGQEDGYPFVLSPAVVEKLRFVHDTIALVACPLPSEAFADTAAAPPS